MTTSALRALLVAGVAATALAPAALGLLPTAASVGHTSPDPEPSCSADPGGQSGEHCPSPSPDADPSPNPHASRNPHVSPSPEASSSASPSPTAAPPPQPHEVGCRDIAGGRGDYVRRSATDAAGSLATLVIWLGGDPTLGQVPVPTCPGVTYTVTISDYENASTVLFEERIAGDGIRPFISVAKHLPTYTKRLVQIDVTVTEFVEGVLVEHDAAGNAIDALLNGGTGGQTWK